MNQKPPIATADWFTNAPRRSKKSFTFNGFGRIGLALQRGSQSAAQAFTYTANGQVLTALDGDGNLSTWVYDGFDRVHRLRFPNPSTSGSSTTDYEEYEYDPNGNVTTHRTRAAQSFTATYDTLNRRTLLTTPGAMANVTTTYDNLGRVTGVSEPGHALTFAWDALGRLTGLSHSSWNQTGSLIDSTAAGMAAGLGNTYGPESIWVFCKSATYTSLIGIVVVDIMHIYNDIQIWHGAAVVATGSAARMIGVAFGAAATYCYIGRCGGSRGRTGRRP